MNRDITMYVKVIVFNLFTLTEWVKHFLYSHYLLFVCLFDLTVILLEYSRFYSVQVLGINYWYCFSGLQVYQLQQDHDSALCHSQQCNLSLFFNSGVSLHFDLLITISLLHLSPPPLFWPVTLVVLHTKTNWWPTRNQSRGNWYSLWPFWPL